MMTGKCVLKGGSASAVPKKHDWLFKMDAKSRKCLVRWHEYSDSVTVAVQTLRYDEELLDVTLACEGQTIRAHKLVLAASSQYFRQVLKDYPCEHPTVVIDGIRWKDLLALLQFMYYGQVLVEEEAVLSLLTAASSLAVIGLSYVTAALTQAKLNPKEDLEIAKEETVTKEAEKNEERKEGGKEITLPDASSLSLSTGIQDQMTNKDKPSSSLITDTRITNSSFNSLNSLEPNISSVVNNEKTSFTSLSQASRKKTIDQDDPKVTIHPPCKRPKTVCENDPPDVRGRLHRLDLRDDVLKRICEGSDSVDNLNKVSDKDELKRIQPRDKVLSERRLNEENQRECGSPELDLVSNHHTMVNGDNQALSKPFDDRDSLDNELSQDGSSPENGDSDMGPAPLPMNHPAVLAASSSVAAASAAAAAAAAALAVAANGGGMSPAVNYAALLAANTRGIMSPSGVGSGSPLHSSTPSPSGISLPVWIPPASNTSPSPSPPAQGNIPQGFIHPPGMSQQDLQATLEQYQRKLAFHEPRPCPTCKRMYRDAATLRTHIAIMHSEGKEPFACTCGALFRTKYDMYQHKKNGHR